MAKATKKKKTVGVVLPDWLNVRVEPNGKIVEPIAKGTAVNVVVTNDEWTNISVGDLSGWVKSCYLAVGQGDE